MLEGEGHSSVVEHLLRLCKVLGLIPSTADQNAPECSKWIGFQTLDIDAETAECPEGLSPLLGPVAGLPRTSLSLLLLVIATNLPYTTVFIRSTLRGP